jgi:hypothetical protein
MAKTDGEMEVARNADRGETDSWYSKIKMDEGFLTRHAE